VVPYGGNRSAPGVLPAFAGVVHDRQSAADYEYRHSEDRFSNRTLVTHDSLISTSQSDTNTQMIDNSLR
jgi:hypothetical protein